MQSKKIGIIISKIKKQLGKTRPVVLFEKPFLVLVSTVLSQRTRDANTELASKQLFAKFSTPKAILVAPLKQIEKLIKPAGFYKVKARRLKELSKALLERFAGKVPKSIEELLSLPGVGRKTANCVLVYAFQIPALPVDTHVHRISNRLGLVKTSRPAETEIALTKAIPKRYWIELNELMVKFGQRVCLSITPRCKICNVSKYCGYFCKTLPYCAHT
jgi:endonuclease-3